MLRITIPGRLWSVGNRTALSARFQNYSTVIDVRTLRRNSGWYQSIPPQTGEQSCYPVNPGDEMSASTYYSGGVYYSGIWDGSSGDGCTSQHQMWMGAPLYANWIDEQQVNPSDTNVRFTTPSFNKVLFQDQGG